MIEHTQLERALKVAEEFKSSGTGSFYCYAYLGQASYDATAYAIIDGLCLSSKRIWHLDETRTDCVGYIGKGNNGRIDNIRHPFVPENESNRIKLREGVSHEDAIELEKLLIAELGCLLDDTRNDGCLANIQLYQNGPRCCRSLEAFIHKLRANEMEAVVKAAIQVTQKKTFAMTSNKEIVAEGSREELARLFLTGSGSISACCLGNRAGIWSKSLGHAVYFCDADDYEAYTIKPMTTQEPNKNRVIIASRLDNSDTVAGTATEIAAYASEIKHSSALHAVAQGKQASAYGWVASYSEDETADTPALTPYSFF